MHMIKLRELAVNPEKIMGTTKVSEDPAQLPPEERVAVGDIEPDYLERPAAVAPPEKHRKAGSVRIVGSRFHFPRRLLMGLLALGAAWHLLPPTDKGPQIEEMSPPQQAASEPAKLPTPSPVEYDPRDFGPRQPSSENMKKEVARLEGVFNRPAPTPGPTSTSTLTNPLGGIGELTNNVGKAISSPPLEPSNTVPPLPSRH